MSTPSQVTFTKPRAEASATADACLAGAGLPTYSQLLQALRDLREAVEPLSPIAAFRGNESVTRLAQAAVFMNTVEAAQALLDQADTLPAEEEEPQAEEAEETASSAPGAEPLPPVEQRADVSGASLQRLFPANPRHSRQGLYAGSSRRPWHGPTDEGQAAFRRAVESPETFRFAATEIFGFRADVIAAQGGVVA